MNRISKPSSMMATCALVAACATPDLGADIAQTRTMLAGTLADVKPDLARQAALELQQAERAAAARGERILSLPGDCPGQIALGPEFDVSDCKAHPRARPDTGPVNATQILDAFQAMDNYFAALEALALARTADEIKTNSANLFTALSAVEGNTASAALSRLGARAKRDGPTVSAIAGFAAEQQRVAALRRIMRAADPVLDEIVRGAQSGADVLGDPILDRRDAVTAAIDAYENAAASGSPSRQLTAAEALRTSLKAMHSGEAQSPLRRLYIARQIHGAMLAKVNRAPDLDQLQSLTTQIAEINTLLENRK